MSETNYEAVLKIVKDAGQTLKQSFSSTFHIAEKSSFNYVTEMDLKMQELLMQELSFINGEFKYICEESEKNIFEYENTWLVDPIDGTTNYIHGYPHFSIALAHALHGNIVFSAIYNPISDELFHAELGRGSYLNGESITVSKTARIEDSLLVMGLPYDRKKSDFVFDIMKSLHGKCSDIKRRGSASLDFADVACGRADAYFELDLKPWDIAPGTLLVTEAGGDVKMSGSLIEGKASYNVLATNNQFKIKEFENCIGS